jgi:hypothetical protein
MPALPPYIPTKDALLNNWLLNFSSLITAAPATYGLVAGDATAIAGAVATWSAAYALVTSPTTKTASTVSAKNAAKVTTLATCRPYAQNISLNAGVTSANKTAVGVNPRTSVPTPITTPTTYAVLTVAQALALQHVIRYRDSLASPSVKSKPYGVIAVQLFGLASATVITDPTLLTYLQSVPKSPFLQSWGSGSVGMKAYYAARYVTRKGLLGPWSPIVSFTIAA